MSSCTQKFPMAIDAEHPRSIVVAAELAGYRGTPPGASPRARHSFQYWPFKGGRGNESFAAWKGRNCKSMWRGQDWLSANPESAEIATLIYDGFVTLESGRTDALIAEIRSFGSGPGAVLVHIPSLRSDL